MIKVYKDHHSFYNRYERLLRIKEIENELLLGLLANGFYNLKEDNQYYAMNQEGGKYLAVVMMGKGAIFAGHEATDDMILESVKALIQSDVHVQSIGGPLPYSTMANEAFQTLACTTHKLKKGHRLFKLTQVKPIRPCLGSARLVTIQDLDLLVHWSYGFASDIGETVNESERDDVIKKTIDRIESRQFYFWVVDDVPVSMAGKNRPTKNGMTVSYVYTPPVYRGKGYASALVAQLSREILLEKTYASLYTDIQNPTSNKIYQLIGYEPVGDSTIFFY